MRAREHAVEVNVVLASGHPEDLLFFTVFFSNIDIDTGRWQMHAAEMHAADWDRPVSNVKAIR
jgi:hypothetical protein